MQEQMKVAINGKPEQIAEQTSLNELIQHLGLGAKRGLAISVNQVIHPKGEWINVQLSENDQIIIIQAAQGG